MSINVGSRDNLHRDLFGPFLARSLFIASLYRRYNKYLFSRAPLFSPPLDAFFSADSLAPPIRTFSPAFPPPSPSFESPACLPRAPNYLLTRSDLRKSLAFRLSNHTADRKAMWRPHCFSNRNAKSYVSRKNKYFHRKHV